MSINKSIKNVLITGARAPVTLHLCRMFYKRNINVFAADSTAYPISKVSNSISKFFLLPSPKYNTPSFVEEINRLIQEYSIDLIIPTCEETFYISKFKQELKCEVLVDNISNLALLHNKLKFIEFAKKFGLKIPFTIDTNNIEIAKEKITLSSYNQFVLKPIYSRFSDRVKFTTKEHLISNDYAWEPGWIIQQRIEGIQYCSYSIAQNGKLLAHTNYKTEFTAGLGATIAFDHIDIPPIHNFVSEIVKELNFSGQIAFDFIMDKNGDLFPIECNPRATSGLHLFSDDVIDAMIGKVNFKLITPDTHKKFTIKLALLLYGFTHWKSISSFKKWFKTFITHSDIVYHKTDRQPFFYQFYSMYQLCKNSKKEGRSLLEQTTFDISWDGDE